MNIERLYDTSKRRHRVWCNSDELTRGGDGTYSFKDEGAAAEIGYSSEVIVIDMPGKLLFYDNDKKVLYDWTGEG